MADEDKSGMTIAPSGNQSGTRGYFGEIVRSAKTILEGMAITFAELTRAPNNTTTVQYPDRTPVPVADTLPERYRGFLEVDLDICTGCKACERDCPINVIAIDLEKFGSDRMMTRFDIDMGKCMYCGICVESCPVESQAPPGDHENSKAIRMTREFEGATGDFNTLTFRFIRPGDLIPPFKPKKGETPTTVRKGEIAREVRAKAQEYNPPAVRWAMEHAPQKLSEDEAEYLKEETLLARARELEGLVRGVASDEKALEGLLVNQALAQTDAGRSGYANCHEYARAMVAGTDKEYWKCGPGGAQATRDMNLIFELRAGKSALEAVKSAAAVTLAHHKKVGG